MAQDDDEEDDPFHVFGGDDDDGDDDESGTEKDEDLPPQQRQHQQQRQQQQQPQGGGESSLSLARTLMEQANRAMGGDSETRFELQQNPTNITSTDRSQGTPQQSLKNASPSRSTRSQRSTITTESSPEITLPSCWPPPLYVGPIAIVTAKLGGGRACRARHNLLPGTLLLVEAPALAWTLTDRTTMTVDPHDWCDSSSISSSPQLIILTILERICHHPQGKEWLHAMEYLHPTREAVRNVMVHAQFGPSSLQNPPQPIMEEEANVHEATAQIKDMLCTQIPCEYHHYLLYQRLVEFMTTDSSQSSSSVSDTPKPFYNSDGTPLSSMDVDRLILVLRYNALQSGLFFYSAMWNHGEPPNCVKFQPRVDPITTATTTITKTYSEIRTTRFVPAGEELTISYLPNLLSYSTRRRILWMQHRFDIGPGPIVDTILWDMEWVGHPDRCIPVSNQHWKITNTATNMIATTSANTSQTHHDQKCTNGRNKEDDGEEEEDDDDDDDDGYHDFCKIVERIENTVTELDDARQELLSVAPKLWTEHHMAQAQALELTTLELCLQAMEQLQNPHHLLLIPCRVLHVECCDLVLSKDTSLSINQQVQLMGRLVVSTHSLVKLQTLCHGPDHFDLARSYQDLSQSIAYLLGQKPRHLIEMGLEGLTTVQSWSVLENNARRQHERIKALYPYDVKTHIERGRGTTPAENQERERNGTPS